MSYCRSLLYIGSQVQNFFEHHWHDQALTTSKISDHLRHPGFLPELLVLLNLGQNIDGRLRPDFLRHWHVCLA